MRQSIPVAIMMLPALALPDPAWAARSTDRSAARMAPEFVAMDGITTPIFGESRIEGALSVTLVLQTANPAAAAALRKQLPQMRAVALSTTLEFSRLFASGFTPVDARRLSRSLNAALKPAFPGIGRVLIVKLSAEPA